MQITQLNHVNLRTTQLDAMISWYQDVLGLVLGPRPDFPFPGAWLYAGDTAFVHLVGIEGEAGTGSEVELKLEHFAFSANGAKEFENRLQEQGVEFRKSEIAAVNLVAFNVWDPDGNHIHVDFRIDE
ncbi:VOC family protein [uncultured Roseibium sp.]|uniref:VOC family protein n=1 Tax=uncultured Roseibium sp. TaxID=1936171 RepID=UPI002634AC27|nr:VOC family protein [uncultured Roseibium sp.]